VHDVMPASRLSGLGRKVDEIAKESRHRIDKCVQSGDAFDPQIFIFAGFHFPQCMRRTNRKTADAYRDALRVLEGIIDGEEGQHSMGVFLEGRYDGLVYVPTVMEYSRMIGDGVLSKAADVWLSVGDECLDRPRVEYFEALMFARELARERTPVRMHELPPPDDVYPSLQDLMMAFDQMERFESERGRLEECDYEYAAKHVDSWVKHDLEWLEDAQWGMYDAIAQFLEEERHSRNIAVVFTEFWSHDSDRLYQLATRYGIDAVGMVPILHK